jgi:hypothetical protein
MRSRLLRVIDLAQVIHLNDKPTSGFQVNLDDKLIMKRSFVGVFLATMLTMFAAHAEALGIMVPAYFYPSSGDYWDSLDFAASRAPLIAIMNVNSGPGTSRDSAYVQALAKLHLAGGKVTGYVYTSYGTRPLADVEADIDLYLSFYAVDRFLIDEMASDENTNHLDYYAAIYQYIKAKGTNYSVTGNPGSNTQEDYITRPTTDSLALFENDGTNYPSFTPSSWVAKYPAWQFVHVPYDVATATTMSNYVGLAVSRNAGWIYITDAMFPNPYDTLPSYWTNEVNLVQTLNTASLPVNSTFAHIAIDGSFDDWTGVPLAYTSPAGPSNAIQYENVYIANDQTDLYIRFTLYSPRAAFQNSYDNIFIDADDNFSTGYLVGDIGSEMLIQNGAGYQEKSGQFNAGGINNLAWHIAGSANSMDWELSISLGATYAIGGAAVFSNSTIAILLEGDTPSYATGILVPLSGGLVYTFAPAPPGPLSISYSGGKAIISWPGSGTLQSCGLLTHGGTWTNVPGAGSPYSIPSTNTPRFFRLIQP